MKAAGFTDTGIQESGSVSIPLRGKVMKVELANVVSSDSNLEVVSIPLRGKVMKGVYLQRSTGVF